MYNHILVPIDLDALETSDKAVKTATQIAKDYGSVLHFLTVVPPLGSYASSFFPKGFRKEAAESALQKLHDYTAGADFGDTAVHHIVANGAIYDQILSIREKTDADLIVMASHRPELSDCLLGPNAARVVRHAPCSVMVVRS